MLLAARVVTVRVKVNCSNRWLFGEERSELKGFCGIARWRSRVLSRARGSSASCKRKEDTALDT